MLFIQRCITDIFKMVWFDVSIADWFIENRIVDAHLLATLGLTYSLSIVWLVDPKCVAAPAAPTFCYKYPEFPDGGGFALHLWKQDHGRSVSGKFARFAYLSSTTYRLVCGFVELSSIAVEMDQRVEIFYPNLTGGFQQPSRHEGNTEVESSSSIGMQGKSFLRPAQSQQTARQTTLHAQFTTEQTAETHHTFSSETVLHSYGRRRVREREKKQTQ